MQFKYAYYKNKKSQCLASVIFIAHLINHSVVCFAFFLYFDKEKFSNDIKIQFQADEILAIELLTLVVKSLTAVTIEIAIIILEICGKKVNEVHQRDINDIIKGFRYILQNEEIDERVININC